MRDTTDIWLGELNDLVTVFGIVESCAKAAGYIRSEGSIIEPGWALSVWRHNRNGGEIEEVDDLERTLPLENEDVLMVAYDEPEAGGVRQFLYLICKSENVVERVNMDGYYCPLTEEGDEEFQSAKRQYLFIKELHRRLNAVETLGYLGDECLENPVFRFAQDGSERLIAALEDAGAE